MKYERWAVVNALVVILSIFLGSAYPYISPLAVLLLMAVSYQRELVSNWAPNILTLVRLLAAGLSTFFFDMVGASIVLLVAIIADVADGGLARKLDMESILGSYLDSETDAYIVLVLSLKLAEVNPVLLIPGLLRYLYVLLISLLKFHVTKEDPNTISRVVGFATMSGYLLYFAGFTFPIFYLYGLIVLVSGTFTKDFIGLAFLNSKVNRNGRPSLR